MNSNDKELWIANLMAASDKRAPKEIYDAYAGYLTGVCARYLSDSDDLKDVVQESFINIFSALRSFNYSGAGSLKAWITRIAVNRALKYLRDNNRFVFVAISDRDAEMPDDEPDIESLTCQEITALIRELPPGYRVVFNLHVMEGKSHKEIADILNIKENSSASQFHRAKAMLALKVSELIKLKQQQL